MNFTKIFNISNKKFIIFENQSYEVTKYFSNNQTNFSIYIPVINQYFWIDSNENIIIIDQSNDEYFIDIFFPDIICPISNEIYKNPFNDINSLSYDLDSINNKIKLNSLKTVKDYTQKRNIHILNICNRSDHCLYKNRTLLILINIIKKTKFIYTDQKNLYDLENLETFLFETTCPVYYTIMDHPLITPSGHSYETNTINKLLISNNFKCPLTNKIYRFDDVYINKNLEQINKQIKKINIISINEEPNNKFITIGIKHNFELKNDIDNIFQLIVERKFLNQKKTMYKLFHTLFLIPDIKSSTIPIYINILMQKIKENEDLDFIKKEKIHLIMNNKYLLAVYYSSLEIWFRYNFYKYIHFKKYFVETIKNRLLLEKNSIIHIQDDKILDIENFYKYPHDINYLFSLNTRNIRSIEYNLFLLNKIKSKNFSITSFYLYSLELLNFEEI